MGRKGRESKSYKREKGEKEAKNNTHMPRTSVRGQPLSERVLRSFFLDSCYPGWKTPALQDYPIDLYASNQSHPPQKTRKHMRALVIHESAQTCFPNHYRGIFRPRYKDRVQACSKRGHSEWALIGWQYFGLAMYLSFDITNKLVDNDIYSEQLMFEIPKLSILISWTLVVYASKHGVFVLRA